jgi:hypothetical protein
MEITEGREKTEKTAGAHHGATEKTEIIAFRNQNGRLFLSPK